MMDVEFYRDAVFEIVLNGLHIPREVCELRYHLFRRAAHVYFHLPERNCEVIEPFPTCFFDFRTKLRRYDDLKLCIEKLPELSEINVSFF